MRGTRTKTAAHLGVLLLLLGLGALAACGPATTATNTVPPAATGTQPVIGSPAIQAATTTARGTTVVTTRGTTVVTTGGTTAVVTTRGTTVVTGRGTTATGTAARPAEPGLAYRNLQALDSYRQVWDFSGFALAGNQGDLRAVHEVNGNDIHGVLSSGGNTVFEAYRIDDRIYVTNPLGGGFIEADAANPLASPARAFFDLPRTILTGLTPANADYRPTGTVMADGRPATTYFDDVELANLGFIDPSLQGQRGTAATTLTITNDQSILVGTEAEFKPSTGGDTRARARLNVTDIGQVGPITPPR